MKITIMEVMKLNKRNKELKTVGLQVTQETKSAVYTYKGIDYAMDRDNNLQDLMTLGKPV